MTSSLMTCRIWRSAEDDLRQIIRSLITAEPSELEGSQRLLENLVGALGEIESSARREPSLPVKEILLGVRATLARAETLSSIALQSLNQQISLTGLQPVDAGRTLRFEA